MEPIWQAIQAIWAGMTVGFQAFFSALPIYDALSDIQDQMWAYILGVPVAVISVGGLIITGIKIVRKFI